MDKLLSFSIPGPDGKPQEIQAPGVIPQGGLEEGGAGEKAIQNGISIFLILVIILSIIFLIWGGIKWITASGDKAKLDSARKTIIYSLIGMILAILSFAIVSLVGSTIGIEFFN